jgi:hypothetical protein
MMLIYTSQPLLVVNQSALIISMDFNPAKMTFYGTLQPKEMLRQFTQLRDNTAYDACRC